MPFAANGIAPPRRFAILRRGGFHIRPLQCLLLCFCARGLLPPLRGPPPSRREAGKLPAIFPFSVGADSIFARRRLSDRLPPGWEQGAVASPQRPAPQGCLKEKAQSKEDTFASTKKTKANTPYKANHCFRTRGLLPPLRGPPPSRREAKGSTAVGG